MISKIRSVLIISLFVTAYFGACSNPVDSHEEHFEPIGLYIIASGDTIVKYTGGTVEGGIDVDAGDETAILNIRFIQEDGDVGVPPTSDWALDWEISDTTIAAVESHGDELENYNIHIMPAAGGAGRSLTGRFDRNIRSIAWDKQSKGLYFTASSEGTRNLRYVRIDKADTLIPITEGQNLINSFKVRA